MKLDLDLDAPDLDSPTEHLRRAEDLGSGIIVSDQDPIVTAIDRFARSLVDPRRALEREIIPPAAWLDAPYYSGALGTYDASTRTGCWPATRKAFLEVTETPGVEEIISTGALGTGKTDLAIRLVIRWLYELSCFVSPQRLLGLQDHSIILFMLIHMNQQRAKRKLYAPVVTALKRIPYFQKEFRWNHRVEKSVLEFPKGIQVRFGVTDPEAVRSEDLIVMLMDEVNFMDVVSKSKRDKEGRSFDAAEEIHETAKFRQATRFAGTSLWPAKRVLLSSRDRTDDFLERREREVRKDAKVVGPPEDQFVYSKDGKILIVSRALWKAKPLGSYPSDHFDVQVGFRGVRSKVLHAGEDAHPQARVVQVPRESAFVEAFARNVDKALRELGGVAIEGVGRLFPNDEALDGIWQDDLVHPFSRMTTTLRDGGMLMERLLFKDNKPRCCPERWRFIHLDAAATEDNFGFGCTHVHGHRVVERVSQSGESTKSSEPIYRTDLALEINPPEGGGEIKIAQVLSLVMLLRDLGMRIACVSYDSWQRLAISQALENEGFHCERLSVDSDIECYLNFRDAVDEGRYECYPYPPLEKELRQLIYYRHVGRVDHPPRAGKDVADAVCGSVAGALKYGPAAAMDGRGMNMRVEVY